MRRRTGLLFVTALLLILAGGYTAFWFITAGKIEQGLGEWAEAARAQKIAASWRTLRVAGFPCAFRLELSDAALRDEAINPPADIRMPLLSASAHPWSFGVWHLTAPQGLSAVAVPEGKPAVTVSARAVEGAVSAVPEGGTAEIDNLTLRWGTLAVRGSGTLALDYDLQPMGAFSGAVEGYDELMNALVAAGRMKASDARLARIGLAMLAKAGPSGRPAITASFTIQNGEMFLGPAKLGPAPKIPWE